MEEVTTPLSAVIGAGLQCTQAVDLPVVTRADVMTTDTSTPLFSETRDLNTACKEMETGLGSSNMFEPAGHGQGESLHYTLEVSDDPLQADDHQSAALTPTSCGLTPPQVASAADALLPHSTGAARAPMAADPSKDYSLAPTTLQQPCSFVPAYNHQDESGIGITVEGQELWEEFYKRGTEMIVNRAGR